MAAALPRSEGQRLALTFTVLPSGVTTRPRMALLLYRTTTRSFLPTFLAFRTTRTLPRARFFAVLATPACRIVSVPRAELPRGVTTQTIVFFLPFSQLTEKDGVGPA